MEKKNLTVQLFVSTGGGEGLIGTAYPVAPNILMSAAHVVGDGEGTKIEARWWHLAHSDREWIKCCRVVWDGRKQSPVCDVVLLECDFPTSVEQHWGRLAAVRPKDHAEWSSEGFPFVGEKGSKSVPLKGTTYSMGDQSQHFHLEETAAAKTEKDWKGASGSPVFVDDSIIGVIVNSPLNYNANRFEAVPVFRLLQNAEFRSLVQYSEAEDQRKQLSEAAIRELLTLSSDAVSSLAEQLRIPPEKDQRKMASAIINSLLEEADSVQLATRIVQAMRRIKISDESHQHTIACLKGAAMYLIPASLATQHVQQIRVIADGGPLRFSFHASTEAFVEIGIARLHGRPTMFDNITSRKDMPRPRLILQRFADVEIDKDGEKFKKNFVIGLCEALSIAHASEWSFERQVKAINSELKVSKSLDEHLPYYIYKISNNADERLRHERIFQELHDLFEQRLAFVPLESDKSPSKESDEDESVGLLKRILCEAAGIEWRIDGQDKAP